MHQDPQSRVLEAFQAIDREDLQAFFDMLADDMSHVDEICKQWLRGKAAVVAALSPLFSIIQSVKSALSDFHVTTTNDLAVVTCMLNQSYIIEGKSTTIVAPTTCVLRRENGVWKFALMHTLPFCDA